MKLTPIAADKVSAPMIAESPVNIECRVVNVEELGSHHMFIAEVLAVHADEKYMDEKGKFELAKAEPVVYSHGTYFSLDKPLGTFGYSVRKNQPDKKAGKAKPQQRKKKKPVNQKEQKKPINSK